MRKTDPRTAALLRAVREGAATKAPALAGHGLPQANIGRNLYIAGRR